MKPRRKTIPLKPHEDRQIKRLYLLWRFPVDQYAQRPRALAMFTEEWNRRSGRHDTPDEIRHYMLTKRKAGKWPRFDGDYEPLRSPKPDDLKPYEWNALRTIWAKNDLGREQYACSAELRDSLSRDFLALTGRAVSGDLLYAAAMAMQKHKEYGWPQVKKDNLGFGDIDQVA